MLRINQILDIKTGKVLETEEILKEMSEQDKHMLRAMQLGPKKILNYSCPACSQKVYLSGTGRRVYHFRHFPNKGKCELKDNKKISKEDRKKIIYNGAKESDRHKELKLWLGNFIKGLESYGDFANTNIEKRVTSADRKKHWRQPDVSCAYKGKRVVFELQLNSTFVEVIQGRDAFYAKEHTFICWLFDGFDPSDSKFGEKDIFWLNKSNAFVITKETMRLSEEKKDLMIECHCNEYIVDGEEIKDNWVPQILPFSDLQLKEGYYKPFYFDSDAAKAKLELQLLGDQFEKYFWGIRKNLDYLEQKAEDKYFIGKFKALLENESIPDEFTAGSVGILDALYYLKTGKTEQLNYHFKNLKEFTNLIMEAYREHGYIFCMAVKKFRPTFKSDKLSDKLKKKVKDFWKTYKATEGEGMSSSQDKRYDSIVKILFPELEEYLAL